MKRDRSMDLMKCVLVLGMIIAHVIQFFSESNFIANGFSIYINMITFSGFLFCFGYVCNIAYLKKNKKHVKVSLIKNSIKMILAFYLSAMCYEICLNGFDFKVISFLKILLLWRISGYSEFLLSFALINIFTYVFFNQIKYIVKSKYILFVALISLGFTFIPYELIKINQLGLIIGSTKFASFPIIQYLLFYLLGIYFQQNNIGFRMNYLLISIASSSLFVMYFMIFKRLPSRFPPSIVWILSPMIYLYLYYLICKKITQKYDTYKSINIIGENTLFFLLSSNIIIFVTKNILKDIKFNLIECIIFSMIIIIITYILLYILDISYKWIHKDIDKKLAI